MEVRIPLSALVVEDNEADAELVELAMRDTLYPIVDVTFASTLGQALERVEQGCDIDVIITDLRLADSEGAETVKGIKKACPAVPLVVVSGNDDLRVVVDAIHAGADDFVSKRYLTPRSLSSALGRATARKAERDRRRVHQRREGELTRHLRQSQTLLQTVIDNLPVPVTVADLDGAAILANRASLAITCLTARAYLGSTYEDLLTSEQAAQARSDAEAVLERWEPIETTSHVTLPDGQEHTLRVARFPVSTPSGDPAGVGCISVDVTEELARVRRIAQLAAIVEGSADAIFAVGTDLRVETWNQAAEVLFGWTEEEMRGQLTDVLIPEDRLGERNEAIAQLAQGKRCQIPRTKRSRKDGSEVDVWLSLSPITGAGGEITGFAAMSRDLTQQLEAEDERAALAERAERARHLEHLSEMAAGVAHDFNNFLNLILNNAQLLREGLDEPEQRTLADQIIESARRGARLGAQLMELNGGRPRQLVEIDTNACVTAAHRLIAQSMPDSIQVRLELDPGAWPVRADPTELESAVVNLAVNASHAMPDGGNLTICTANARIEGEAAVGLGVSPGDYVQVEVCDDGIGMTPEVRERAFEPFFSTKGVGRGAGLGLARVLSFVRHSRGAVDVHTDPGAGTRVAMYLQAKRDLR